MAELDQLNTSVQALGELLGSVGNALIQQSPTDTSGKLTATKVVQVGFVRVLGISVITAGVAGKLHDTNSVGGVAVGNQIYTVPAAVGFIPVNMVFATGLVYAPGAGQEISIHFARQ